MPLKSVPGIDVRPTTDKTKETLFNVLTNDVYGATFLDLFSGTGAIAIEALSRGAKQAFLVENNRKAIKCIEENLTFTKLTNSATLIKSDVFSALRSFSVKKMKFDIIFLDPPYDQELEKRVILDLNELDILDEDGIIIVESSKETDFSYINETDFRIYKEKIYKNNKHTFICK